MNDETPQPPTRVNASDDLWPVPVLYGEAWAELARLVADAFMRPPVALSWGDAPKDSVKHRR
jgi:hypothetical protein